MAELVEEKVRRQQRPTRGGHHLTIIAGYHTNREQMRAVPESETSRVGQRLLRATEGRQYALHSFTPKLHPPPPTLGVRARVLAFLRACVRVFLRARVLACDTCVCVRAQTARCFLSFFLLQMGVDFAALVAQAAEARAAGPSGDAAGAEALAAAVRAMAAAGVPKAEGCPSVGTALNLCFEELCEADLVNRCIRWRSARLT